MANTSLPVVDGAGATQNVDAYSLPNGDIQQAVVIGDGAIDGRIAKIDTDGSIQVETNRATTATVTLVAASTATSVQILPANGVRRGAIVYNSTGAVLNLRYGSTAATATLWSVKLAANASWIIDVPTWEGAVQGIWVGTVGTTAPVGALVTDMSA